MNRRQFLTLGAVATGTYAMRGLSRLGSRPAAAQISAPPTVDRLVLTNVVDNIYDIFAKGGRLDRVTVERTPIGAPPSWPSTASPTTSSRHEAGSGARSCSTSA